MLEINGDEGHVDLAKKLIIQLLSELKRDEELDFQRLKYDADMLERENKDVVKALLDHVIVTTAAGKPIKSKTLGQKSYIEKNVE